MPETPDNINKQSLNQKVLGVIEAGAVTMRPRWHYVLKTLLAVLGFIIVLLTGIYLASFIIFVLRRSGILEVPMFGLSGWYAALLSLPWLLVFMAVLFIILLEILVRRYAFAYRQPLLLTLLGIAAVVTMTGYVAARTPLHRHIAVFAERRQLPIAHGMYRDFERRPLKNIYPGKIIILVPQGFEMQNPDNERLIVRITSRTRLPRKADFSPGDMVVVFGQKQGVVVDAMGVREIPE